MTAGESYFERFKGEDDRWYYALVAPNHRITGPSEGYDDKTGATRGILTHVANVFEALPGTADAEELAVLREEHLSVEEIEEAVDIRDRE
jgi:uncharacterized protein YegP (UPF0339 family)